MMAGDQVGSLSWFLDSLKLDLEVLARSLAQPQVQPQVPPAPSPNPNPSGVQVSDAA